MAPNPGLQVTLNVKNRSCLVLGGDDEAADKVHRLLEAGARVTVVHPSLNEVLRKLTASGKILHRGRRFRATDTDGVVLILNAIRDDADLSASLFELGQRERVHVWSVDQPDVSTVSMPALVSHGHLRIAISTSGVAPGLASRLRQDLESLFDEGFVQFLESLASLREDTQAVEPDYERRRAILREALEGVHLTGRLDYPKTLAQQSPR